eukprot:15341331-Ditylum_brightwellii.AAC.1
MSVCPAVVAFMDEAQSVLTFRDHHEGTQILTMHPCCWISWLTASMPDQFCHDVMKPQIVRQMKVSPYSNTYHTYQQNGSFNALDTCSFTCFGCFDFEPILSSEAEAKSAANRPDANALLSIMKGKTKYLVLLNKTNT